MLGKSSVPLATTAEPHVLGKVYGLNGEESMMFRRLHLAPENLYVTSDKESDFDTKGRVTRSSLI